MKNIELENLKSLASIELESLEEHLKKSLPAPSSMAYQYCECVKDVAMKLGTELADTIQCVNQDDSEARFVLIATIGVLLSIERHNKYKAIKNMMTSGVHMKNKEVRLMMTGYASICDYEIKELAKCLVTYIQEYLDATRKKQHEN